MLLRWSFDTVGIFLHLLAMMKMTKTKKRTKTKKKKTKKRGAKRSSKNGRMCGRRLVEREAFGVLAR